MSVNDGDEEYSLYTAKHSRNGVEEFDLHQYRASVNHPVNAEKIVKDKVAKLLLERLKGKYPSKEFQKDLEAAVNESAAEIVKLTQPPKKSR